MSSMQSNSLMDKKKKDILYLKRTPTVTYDLTSGSPIPEAIKKYYIQQQLPVRKQSLAAANNQTKSELKKRALQQQQQQQPRMPSPMRNSSIPFKIQTEPVDVAIHVETATPTSPQYHGNSQSCPSFNIPEEDEEEDAIESLAVGNTFDPIKLYTRQDVDEDDEDDEFNFKDRPPSSIICIKPMDPDDTEDEDEDEDDIQGKDLMLDEALTEIVESWDGNGDTMEPTTADTTTAPVSPPDSGRRKGSIRDSTPQVKVSHYSSSSDSFPLPPADSQQQQQPPQLESRLSTDTVFTDISDLTMAPNSSSMTESYSSVFLSKMQSKREEQQKSIDAYRSQHVVIYTALLSEVAKEFHKRIACSTLVKDGIEYHEVFSGKEAVDRLLSILGNNDRLEAIEIGAALRNQNFFHDVNYEPVFIDSADELYAFREMTNTPKDDDIDEKFSRESSGDLQSSDLPNGIYTDLTDCYSPTCTGDNLCYSWSCLKKKSLKQSQQQHQVKEENTRLWSQSVPENVVEATLPEERKRQECIYELIYTEQDFVRDLQYVHEFWVEPLLSQDIIDDDKRREQFVKQVFYNIADVRHVNTELSRALEARQAEKYLVSSIGDVMLDHVRYFHPFVEYGAHQVIGKFTFELEKKRNPLFAQFVEETERKPESRRLELNGYLTKPTTRLGRYNLLLREILKRTPDDNPDKETIPQIMDIITTYLEQVNIEAGKCENFFNLQQIGERLEFKSPADYVDLKLEQPGRQLLMKGRMKRKGNSSSEASDLQVFLFDHYLVLAKIKYEDHLEKYKTHRRPIPLELLSINVSSSNRQKRASSILPYSRSTNLSTMNNGAPRPSTSESLATAAKPSSLSITFIHHGRKGAPAITLFTSASSMQQIWIKKIMDQKALLSETRSIFTIAPLIKHHFTVANRVNNTATIYNDNMEQVIVGADQGVYVTKRDPATKKNIITRIITVEKVSQIELMPESQLLVLADKTLWTFPLEILASGASPQAKRGRSVSQNTAFFHVGECLSKTLVCVVKSNTLSATTIRVLEPVIMDENKKTKSLFSLKRLVRSGPVGLKAYKDLYLPSEASSINLLKSKMCISSPREIGVVDMKNFGVQALLDPEDEELGFVFHRPDVRPITIYRIQFGEYLVCYNEFAFFVDQRGRFIRSRPRIDWEGGPDSFAFSDPYVLAFEPDFIEVRNVNTGGLEQVIRGKNIRCTSTNTHNTILQGAMDDPENEGYQVVFQLEKLAKKGHSMLPPPSSY